MRKVFIFLIIFIGNFGVGQDFKYDPFLPKKVYQPSEGNYVVTVNYLAKDKLNEFFCKLYPEIKYSFLEDTKLLFMYTSQSRYQTVKNLLDKIDLPSELIKISISVVELSENDLLDMGISWEQNEFQIKKSGVSAKDGFLLKLNNLVKSGKATVLARPEITSVPNKQAEIKIGEKIPYAVPINETSGSKWTVQYLDAGIKVRVISEVVSGNQVKAHIQPEVSSIKQWKATQAGDFPIMSTRELDVNLTVRNKETTVLGGLLSKTQRANVSSLPILGDIPLLGELFKTTVNENEQTEIVFLVTFEII